LFLFVKEKFKVKLTEYMIRRIMLELSLYPDRSAFRHLSSDRCFLFWFSHLGVQIYLFKQEELKKNIRKPFLSMTERKE